MSSTPPVTLELQPVPARRREPWGLLDVLLVALVVFIALNLLVVVAFAIAASFHVDGASLQQLTHNQKALLPLIQDVRIMVPVQALAYIVGLGLMVLIARLRYGMRFGMAIAWRWPRARWARFAVSGALLWLAVVVFSRVLPNPSKSLPIEQVFSNATAAYILALFGIALAPVMEELFFRGMLYPALERRLGVLAGILITAFFFALLHAGQLANSWSPLLVIFLVGVVLTAVRARSGSVAASTLVHAAYNAALFISMYVSTDRFRHLERMAK